MPSFPTMFIFLFLSANMVFSGLADEAIGMDEFGENIVEHNEKMLEGLRKEDPADFRSGIQNSDDVCYPEEVTKSADFDDILDENIEEMNLDNMKVAKTDNNDDNIVSNMKESAMTIFDEEVLEEELAEASAKPSNTPWTLIGVGGGVLVVVLVGVLLAGVMLWKKKKTKKAKIVTSV